MTTTRAVRDANRDAAYAKRMCGCGHRIVEHLEADRDSPLYQPLRFFCRADGCECFRDAGAP